MAKIKFNDTILTEFRKDSGFRINRNGKKGFRDDREADEVSPTRAHPNAATIPTPPSPSPPRSVLLRHMPHGKAASGVLVCDRTSLAYLPPMAVFWLGARQHAGIELLSPVSRLWTHTNIWWRCAFLFALQLVTLAQHNSILDTYNTCNV